MRDGTIAAEIGRDDLSEENIVLHAVGKADHGSAQHDNQEQLHV
jgi:hypothetical protein